jgi:plastocyanin
MKFNFTQLLAATSCLVLGAAIGNVAMAAEHTVAIRDNFFSPRNVTVAPGDSVKWVHQGAAPHTSTSTTGLWDSGVINNGQSFSFTFTNLGSFNYFCTVHGQAMSGKVIVSEAAPPVRDLFLVNLNGKVKTTNSAGAIVTSPENARDFLAECAEEHDREARDLALVYDVDADAIVAVDRADGSTICVVVTFMGGVSLPNPDGSVRERQAFVMEEDSGETNGSMIATERSTRGEGGELLKFSLRGTIQFARAAYEDESSKLFSGTFSTGRKFIPSAR